MNQSKGLATKQLVENFKEVNRRINEYLIKQVQM